jgi:hypothetical protein
MKLQDMLLSRFKEVFRLLLLPLLIAAGVLWLTDSTVYAQEPQGAIIVRDSDAQPNFPTSVVFSLEAASSSEITDIDLLYGATRGEMRTVVPIEFTPGEQVEAEHDLNTQIFHLPVGVEISYNWLIRDASGNELETPLQTMFYQDTRFDWQQASERDITVHWYAGDKTFGSELLAISTRTLDRLEQDIGATITDPVNIYIYASTSDMRAALRANSVEWVGGQAVPYLGLIIGVVAPGNMPEAQRIIPHELSHQVLYQATENPYGGKPLWFDEGLAVYNQEEVDWIFPRAVAEAARNDTLIPLEALAASFPADSDRAMLSYAQSYSVVQYIFDTYGSDQIAELVQLFSEATPAEEAIPAALGVSVDELDAAWRETLPPAEVSGELTGSPRFAPESRFSDEPAIPSISSAPPASPVAAVPAQPVSASASGPMIGSIMPGWFELALFAAGIAGMVLLTVVVLFFTFRLLNSGSGE